MLMSFVIFIWIQEEYVPDEFVNLDERVWGVHVIRFHRDSILLILSQCFLLLIINQHNCTFLDSLLLSIHLPLFSIPHLTLNVHYPIRVQIVQYCTGWNISPTPPVPYCAHAVMIMIIIISLGLSL